MPELGPFGFVRGAPSNGRPYRDPDRTFDRRKTMIPQQAPVALSLEYADDASHVRQWAAFIKRSGVEKSPGLDAVIDEVADFVLPPAFAAANEQPFDQQWKPPYRWRRVA